MNQFDQIEGRLRAVVFANEENGYTVMKLDRDDGSVVTVVGSIPYAAAGEDFSLVGEWVVHPVYGQQFRTVSFERWLPSDTEGIRLFLGSGILRGIGDATAQRIVEQFGEETFDILSESPDRLREVRGITPRRAEEIGAAFAQQMDIRRLMEFLSSHELDPALALRLYERMGPLAADAVVKNPYMLTEEFYGVSFTEADRFAVSLGHEPDSPLRAQAGVRFVLRFNNDKGHVFIPFEKLTAAVMRLLDHEDTGLAAHAVEQMCAQRELVRETICREDACYLSGMHGAEEYVAHRVADMAASPVDVTSGFDALLSQAEDELGITYAARQREAIKTAVTHRLMILTGGPGTGKTTTIRGLLWMFGKMHLRIQLAAPTGRAAKRMSELCGMEAKTIHRLLETVFTTEDAAAQYQRGEDNPVDADVVVLDELSMVDLPLMHALLAALRPDTRLVMVGDADQLPSVGPGNVLRDMLTSECVTAVHLDEVFRQAKESSIVTGAHAINAGQMPAMRGGKDFFFMRRTAAQETLDTVTELCRTRLPDYFHMEPAQIQVIAPMRVGDVGTRSLNTRLQAALNPAHPTKAELRWGETVFRTGDRVMQVRNNYDIVWRRADGAEAGLGVFNGDIGVIERIDDKTELVTIRYDDRLADYSPELLGELELAYAVTVHKSQGSEFPAVVLVAQECARRLQSRNLLYTAVTRARKLLVVVGREDVLETMVENNTQHKRYTALRVRLRRAMQARTGRQESEEC